MLSPSAFSLGGLDARVHLVWLVVLVVLLGVRAERKRRDAIRHFTEEGGARAAFAAAAKRRRIRLALHAVGLAVLIFASLQPRSNPVKTRTKAEVRDLVILLDVSKSMLAEDRKPNRLSSVKLEISRLAERLAGDRVGLIAFAGDAVVVCPLTSNYSYFRRALGNVSTRTAGQGGTRIGDAIRKAAGDLLGLSAIGEATAPAPGETVLEREAAEKRGRYADLLLLTDGEDHDSYPEYAVRNLLRPNGVGLYVVGVGSPEGRPIRVDGDLLTYRGDVVRTALADKALRELVVGAGRGRYLPAAVHHFDLVEFYEQVVRSDEGREVMEERVEWREVFQPFLLGGLALVLLAFFVPLRPVAERRRR